MCTSNVADAEFRQLATQHRVRLTIVVKTNQTARPRPRPREDQAGAPRIGADGVAEIEPLAMPSSDGVLPDTGLIGGCVPL